MSNDPNETDTVEALASSDDSATAADATLVAAVAPSDPATSETAPVKLTIDGMIDLWFNTEFRDAKIIRETEDWNFMRASVARLKELLSGL